MQTWNPAELALLCPPEPHLPHVLVENGDMTLDEYDEYLHGRGDFIKATKKDSSNERKVSQRQRCGSLAVGLMLHALSLRYLR